MQLDDAVASGSASVLEPGETREATVAFVVFGDRSGVNTVAVEGESFAVD